MITIKTRCELPGTKWVQDRSSFWLHISQHPLQTGLHSLSWLGEYSIQKLKKNKNIKSLLKIMGFSMILFIGFSPFVPSLTIQKLPIKSTFSHLGFYKPLTNSQKSVAEKWQVGGRMWFTAQDQLKTNLELKKKQEEEANETVLAQYISSQYHIAPGAAKKVVIQAYQAAQKQNLDPVLLLAVVGVESRFNPLAGSDAGAVGLVQAMAKAHQDKVQPILNDGGSLTDISTNLQIGAQILKEYLNKQHQNVAQALQQYNGNLNDPTHKYSNKVLNVKNAFDKAILNNS